MKIFVQDSQVLRDPDGKVKVRIEVDESGEDMPQVELVVTGGRLNVYRRLFTKTGDISIHLFG